MLELNVNYRTTIIDKFNISRLLKRILSYNK